MITGNWVTGQLGEDKPPLIIILGPTAVGKTEIAIQLAERLDGEIVSADSRLFYIGMDIGTAKPTPTEQERVPHHLIDVTPPDQTWSLALFQQKARQAIAEIHERGRLPFLVGGTGQYLRAVIEGWDLPTVEPDLRLRAVLERWASEIGSGGLHDRLSLLDPQAAEQIDARNVRRTVRALEVILSTGRLFSDQKRRSSSSYNLLLLGLQRPRAELYARIDTRIQTMLEAGLEEETRSLLAQGYAPGLPSLSAIGYREMVAYIQGKISLEEAIIQMKRTTRIFVRHQANWFKAQDPNIHWFEASSDPVMEMEALIHKWIKNFFTIY